MAIQHRRTDDPPAIGDAVVLGGVKHRIKELDAQGIGHVAVAGPNWRSGATSPVALKRLYWDPLAGVWRLG